MHYGPTGKGPSRFCFDASLSLLCSSRIRAPLLRYHHNPSRRGACAIKNGTMMCILQQQVSLHPTTLGIQLVMVTPATIQLPAISKKRVNTTPRALVGKRRVVSDIPFETPKSAVKMEDEEEVDSWRDLDGQDDWGLEQRATTIASSGGGGRRGGSGNKRVSRRYNQLSSFSFSCDWLLFGTVTLTKRLLRRDVDKGHDNDEQDGAHLSITLNRIYLLKLETIKNMPVEVSETRKPSILIPVGWNPATDNISPVPEQFHNFDNETEQIHGLITISDIWPKKENYPPREHHERSDQAVMECEWWKLM
ncbi:hypothetical protein BC830DRAFT_1082965 [Chytriomyces sp. MP71]|nr:hypothetical protein BC830DRAFT_1082965 [Chytriomyces sp. MP71]